METSPPAMELPAMVVTPVIRRRRSHQGPATSSIDQDIFAGNGGNSGDDSFNINGGNGGNAISNVAANAITSNSVSVFTSANAGGGRNRLWCWAEADLAATLRPRRPVTAQARLLSKQSRMLDLAGMATSVVRLLRMQKRAVRAWKRKDSCLLRWPCVRLCRRDIPGSGSEHG